MRRLPDLHCEFVYVDTTLSEELLELLRQQMVLRELARFEQLGCCLCGWAGAINIVLQRPAAFVIQLLGRLPEP